MEQSSNISQLPSLGFVDSKEVKVFEIKNGSTTTAIVTEYGATLMSLKVDNKELTLCWSDLENLQDPQKNPKYGATCGRVAGRVSNASFRLNGQKYDLEANNGPNCLHGGSQGFDRKVWQGRPIQKAQFAGVEFVYESDHMESGFPGKLTVTSTYLLGPQGELVMEWAAVMHEQADGFETPINLCNHAYWNLSGDFAEKNVGDHLLQLSADKVFRFNQYQCPT